MKVQKLLDREMSRKEFLAFSAFAMASVFGIVGLIKELASHAATPAADFEAESGALASGTTTVTDATASGGAAIKFGTISTGSRDSLVYGTYKPDDTNTGPQPGITLTQWGSSTTNTDFIVGTNRAPTQTTGALGNNQIVENMEIWGRVNVGSFTGVTVKNCIIHGTLIRGVDTAHIIAQGDDHRGATYIDNKLCGRPVTVPTTYTPVGGTTSETLPNPGTINKANEWCGGLRGGNYTIRRCEITNVSDGLNNVYNALIEGNWIHGAWFNEWDVANATTSGASQANSHFYPYSTGTTHYTHCDGIQFSVGKNITVRGNYIGGLHVPGAHNVTPSQAPQIRTGDDFYNSCILIKQENDTKTVGGVTSTDTNKNLEFILIEKNWFYGAVCAINWPTDAYTLAPTDATYKTVVFRSNKFTRASWTSPLYILTPLVSGVPQVGDRTSGVTWTPTVTDPLLVKPGAAGWTGNVFEDTGAAVTISQGA